MTFNLKKAQVANGSVLPQSVSVPMNAKKYNLSLDEKDIKTMNGLLESDRRSLGESPKSYEGLISDARKASVSEKITEGALQDADSSLYPHRQFKDKEDYYDVSPVNAMSHAYDRKYRDAFSKANKGSSTSFWDEFIGAQLDGETTKIVGNVPEKGSQLQNNPKRFSSFDGLPISEDPIVNRDNFGKKVKIKPMNKNEKPIEISSSLKSADKLLFGIYLKASLENRELNSSEKDIVAAINKDKVNMLMTLAQFEDPNINSNDSSQDLPLDNSNNPMEPDFMDGNPTVSGDERLWASESGFDPSQQGIDSDVNNDSGFDFPSPTEPLSGPKSSDISYTGGIGRTTNIPNSPLDEAIVDEPVIDEFENQDDQMDIQDNETPF